jgi:hypothetical protein
MNAAIPKELRKASIGVLGEISNLGRSLQV